MILEGRRPFRPLIAGGRQKTTKTPSGSIIGKRASTVARCQTPFDQMDVQCGEFLIAFLARFSLHHLAHFNCATIVMRDVDPHRTLSAVQEYLVIHGGVAQPVQFLTALSAPNLFRIQPIVCLDLISHSRQSTSDKRLDMELIERILNLSEIADFVNHPGLQHAPPSYLVAFM